MTVPLPQRLDPESQKIIDDGWSRALTPPDKLGHQDLLDVLVGTQIYQLGVDSFMLRSEKRFTGGKVVMEVAYDRVRPDDDRFQVTVIDSSGKVIRAENYTRKEIDETYQILSSVQTQELQVERERRLERIRSFFPKPKEGQVEGAAKSKPKD